MSGTEKEPTGIGIGQPQSMRMVFMVEVAELGSMQSADASFANNFEYGSQGLDVNSIPIALKFGRYRRHTWSTEEDLQELINSSLYPVEERTQYRMMLEAFVFHKQNLAYLFSLNGYKQNASSIGGLHV